MADLTAEEWRQLVKEVKKASIRERFRKIFEEGLHSDNLQREHTDRLCAKITNGTCSWIYRTHGYCDWTRQKQSVLCITGSPGSGKSCLLASMLKNQLGLASELHSDALILTLIFEFSRDLNYSQLLQVLLHQAVGESAMSYIRVNEEDQLDMSNDDLQEVLIGVLIDIGKTRPLFLLIDDLNKLDESVDRLLLPFLDKLLDNARSVNIPLHICYSKRDYPPLELPRPTCMADIQRQIRVDTYNQQDIRLHVEKGISEIYSRWERDVEPSVTDRIIEMAGTGFTAASLFLESVKSHRVSLRKVHSMWNIVFQDLLVPGTSRETRALRMIQCVLTAQRPLSPKEFCTLFDIDIPSNFEIQEVESKLITESRGILCTSSNESDDGIVVSFVQPSLREYLICSHFKYVLMDTLHQDHTEFIEGGHGCFVRAGLDSLKGFVPAYRDKWKKLLPAFSDTQLSLEPGDFTPVDCYPIFNSHLLLEYTVQNLFDHAAQLRNLGEGENFLAELDEGGGRHDLTNGNSGQDNEPCSLLQIWCHLNNCLQGLRVYGPSVTLLHVLAKYNMSQYLSSGLKQGWVYKVKTKNNQTALHWAAFYGSEQAANLLIERSFEDELSFFLNNEAQHKGSYSAWSSYVGRHEYDYGRSALHIAAAKGHLGIVTLLLSFHPRLREKVEKELPKTLEKNGVNDEEDIKQALSTALLKLDTAWNKHLNYAGCGSTALHLAVEGHHPDVVETLLHHGADWRRYANDVSPLQLAMRLAQDEITLRPATKAIVRMLKGAAFAVLDNAETLTSKAFLCDKLFEATRVQINGFNYEKGIQIPITDLLKTGDKYQSNSDLTWFHLPSNNMNWTEILIFHLLGKDNRDRILRNELWTERQIRGSERSYISFMRPGCEKIDNPSGIVLFMPYIHWETQKKQRRLEVFILCKFLLEVVPERLPSLIRQLSAENNDLLNAYANDASDDPKIAALSQEFQVFWKAVENPKKENITSAQDRLRRAMDVYKNEACVSDRDMSLIDLYATDLHNKHSLHIRRTLDQSFYHTLDSTSTRNKDQVVTRYGRREKRKQPVVMMVDQLWLWCIGNTVITCFPQRRECGNDDPDRYDMTDVLENVLQSLRNISADRVKEAEGRESFPLLQKIINECVRACFDPMKNLEDDFKFLDMFSNSISRIADGEVASYERFVKMLKISGQQDLMDIDTESSLLREIKDILDELRMIKLVLNDQYKVIETLIDQRPEAENLRATQSSVFRYQRRVEEMQREGLRTVDSLNALMDLRQRHATLWEAKSTGRQGNTIMVFTVVTILFLPASFMASFFALPVLQFSRTDSDSMNLSYVVKWIMIFTLPVAIVFVSLAFYINDILNVFSRITGHEKRVAKSLAEAERSQIGDGFISGVDDWRDYDDVKTRYKRRVKKVSQDSEDKQLARPVVRLAKWLRNRKEKNDSIA